MISICEKADSSDLLEAYTTLYLTLLDSFSVFQEELTREESVEKGDFFHSI